MRGPRSFVDASPVLFASDRNRNMSMLDGTPDSASTYKGYHIPYQGHTTEEPLSALLRAQFLPPLCGLGRNEGNGRMEDGID